MRALTKLVMTVVPDIQLVAVLGKLSTLRPDPLTAFVEQPYQVLQEMQAGGAAEAQVRAVAQQVLTDLLHS
jgi:hypothetical protein